MLQNSFLPNSLRSSLPFLCAFPSIGIDLRNSTTIGLCSSTTIDVFQSKDLQQMSSTQPTPPTMTPPPTSIICWAG
ncbi:hypothetical protein I3760_13G177300 [Carya illinoinensis]|nr:hypothetical protein I3760_13G177300 [Carya illinoinensis]